MLYQYEFQAMGSKVVAMMDCSPKSAHHLRDIEPLFEQWEQIFSRFRANSELNKVNRADGIPVRVSPEFIEVVKAAQSAELASGGIVNATMLGQILQAGYAESIEMIRNKDLRISGSPNTSVRTTFEIAIDEDNSQVTLPYGLHLDLGGIVKGWAAHKAAIYLGQFAPALVSAGGDMYVTGNQQDGSPWSITIDRPFFDGETIATIAVSQGAIATSGSYRRRWRRNGLDQHHLIDPRTGIPSQSDLVSATIVSDDPIEAEYGAKTTLILGSQDGVAWATKRDLPAFLVRADGSVVFNEQLESIFWSKTYE